MRVAYSRGHSSDESLPARLNSQADHYASGAQKSFNVLPIAPSPTFFMDEYTLFSSEDGWVECNIKTLTERTSCSLSTGHKFRMATSLYNPYAPPSYAYTRATSAYSATVQPYSWSGQLATASGLKQ
ncbi:hypothetical protein C8R43DRAFT_825234, partial [Mycena crocata]